MDYEKFKEQFGQLAPELRKMFMIGLLFDGKLDYTELSNAYVAALQEQQKVEARKLHNSSRWLGYLWKRIPANKAFERAASAYAIVQSGEYKAAPIEKEFTEYLEQHPYTEDENGFPVFKEEQPNA
jgi:hypothetical protein